MPARCLTRVLSSRGMRAEEIRDPGACLAPAGAGDRSLYVSYYLEPHQMILLARIVELSNQVEMAGRVLLGCLSRVPEEHRQTLFLGMRMSEMSSRFTALCKSLGSGAPAWAEPARGWMVKAKAAVERRNELVHRPLAALEFESGEMKPILLAARRSHPETEDIAAQYEAVAAELLALDNACERHWQAALAYYSTVTGQVGR